MSEAGVPTPATRVCAVCGRALDAHENTATGEVTYAHTSWDRSHDETGAAREVDGEDHPAVPVDPSAVPGRPRCDFCHDDDPGWIVPVESFEVRDGANSGDDWLACSSRPDAGANWSGAARRHGWSGTRWPGSRCPSSCTST